MKISLFDPIEFEVAQITESCLAITVSTQSQQADALYVVRNLKGLEKRIEQRRKELVAPLNEQVKMINAAAKQVMAPLEEAESHIKKQLLVWESKLEAIREEELARIAAEAIAKEKALQAERAAVEAARKLEKTELPEDSLFGTDPELDDKESMIAQKMLELEAAQRLEQRSVQNMRVSGTSKFWNFEIIDAELVPRNYLVIDSSLIRGAIRDGVRKIPGVRIFEDRRISIR